MAVTEFKQDGNVGLPYRFTIDAEGKFNLIGGEIKCQDNVMFMLSFMGWFRTYFQDFVPNILWALQKPVSVLETYKTFLLGNFKAAMRKYLLFISVRALNVQYEYKDRKAFGIAIDYGYKLQPEETYRIIRFIKV